jgi:DNA-binding beta-propeller fold protein YncE
MRTSTSDRFALCGALALVTLAGCSGSPAGTVPSTPTGQASLFRQTASAHPDRSQSWMSPDAKSIDLLYVTDLNTGDVDVYSYPAGKPKGVITGLAVPHGECVDKLGNVFVTNGGQSQILEFAHGGTTPIQTLDDPKNFPHGCAIDPVTGNLAVTNSPLGAGAGTVSIYKRAKGKGKQITVGNVFQVYYDGYDPNGNLFVDGTDMHVAFEFAELPAGATAFTPVTLNASVNIPAAVQWDGTNLAVGDQVSLNGPSKIDQFTITGSAGQLVGTTDMTDSCDVLQFWIQGDTVIAPDDCGSTVKFFAYPAGGASTKTLSKNLSEPVGTVVSPKQ